MIPHGIKPIIMWRCQVLVLNLDEGGGELGFVTEGDGEFIYKRKSGMGYDYDFNACDLRQNDVA